MDTIFALSSGAAPAGIGVIRISGPAAGIAVTELAGRLPKPRRASLAALHDGQGRHLDDALILWFPGPRTATGEDVAELHCHGGRAIIAAIEQALAALPGLRKAQAGEFTRRAFANNVVDLAEAEALGDLLAAETELQRSAAMAAFGGQISTTIENWADSLLRLSAQTEAVLDFADEDDVQELPRSFDSGLADLIDSIGKWLERPRSERLGEGYRVVLAGPPNSGKSTLFNALVESEAAITSPIAGTTRDVVERAVSISGIPFVFADTAGLHEESSDEIEIVGIARARAQIAQADCVLWLGAEGAGPKAAREIESYLDTGEMPRKTHPWFRVSGKTGANVAALKQGLLGLAREAMPRPGEAALNARQHTILAEAFAALREARMRNDPLLIGENLRIARGAFDRIVGRTATEDMLDSLFGRFCIGK